MGISQEEMKEFLGQITDQELARYKKVEIPASVSKKDSLESDSDPIFLTDKFLTIKGFDDTVGTVSVTTSKDGELMSFEGQDSEYHHDLVSTLDITFQTDEEWKEFQVATEDEVIACPDRSLHATGYVYSLSGYGDNTMLLDGFIPGSVIYDAMDCISAEAESIYQIVGSLSFSPDDKFHLQDAIMEAEDMSGMKRVVVALEGVEYKGYDVNI